MNFFSKLIVVGLCMNTVVWGQNLLQRGDFTSCEKGIYGECRSNGGKISLYTEKESSNRCGKLEITKIVKTKSGQEIAAASVWIGGDAKNGGFAARPGTTYRFSVKIKGSASKAGIAAVEWVGDRLWYDFRKLKTSVKSAVRVQKDWTVYEGTFTTGPQAKRAALNLNMWHSTQYGPQELKIGDYILFDDVVVEEIPKK